MNAMNPLRGRALTMAGNHPGRALFGFCSGTGQAIRCEGTGGSRFQVHFAQECGETRIGAKRIKAGIGFYGNNDGITIINGAF
jgi:hypothetical protein